MGNNRNKLIRVGLMMLLPLSAFALEGCAGINSFGQKDQTVAQDITDILKEMQPPIRIAMDVVPTFELTGDLSKEDVASINKFLHDLDADLTDAINGVALLDLQTVDQTIATGLELVRQIRDRTSDEETKRNLGRLIAAVTLSHSIAKHYGGAR